MSTIHTNPPLPSHKLELARIRKVSAIMGYVCLAIACAIPLVPLLALALLFTGVVPVPPRWDPAAQEPIAVWGLWTLGVFKVLPMVFLIIGLWRARACFRRFSRGDFFAASAVHALREFSAWTAASAVTALTGQVLFEVLMGSSAHFQRVVFTIATSGHWLTLLFAGTVWVMAAMINHSRSLAEENESFV